MTMTSPRLDIHLSEQLVVTEPASSIFFDLYLEVFGPLRYAAAARHILTRDEWDEEMSDDRVMKIVAWHDDQPVGISLVALDLNAVPWVSPEFYQLRYPGRPVYYCGISLVLPDYQGLSLFSRMMRQGFDRVRRDGAIAAWDCAMVTREQTGLIEKLISVPNGEFPLVPEAVDTQTYFVVDTCPPVTDTSATVIDLRDRTAAECSNLA